MCKKKLSLLVMTITLIAMACGSGSVDTINKINEERQALRGKYAKLAKENETLKEQIVTLEEANKRASQDVVALEALKVEEAELRKQLEAKETQLLASAAEHERELTTLREEIARLRAAEATYPAGGAALNSGAAILERRASTLEAQIAAERSAAGHLQTRLQQKEAAYKESRAALETRIEELIMARDEALKAVDDVRRDMQESVAVATRVRQIGTAVMGLESQLSKARAAEAQYRRELNELEHRVELVILEHRRLKGVMKPKGSVAAPSPLPNAAHVPPHDPRAVPTPQPVHSHTPSY